MELSDETIKSLTDALDAILLNKNYQPIVIENEQSEIQDIIIKINKLAECVSQANDFIYDLSKGNLSAQTPPRSNYLVAHAKQLHANLNHLNWQAQQVAKGDYRQVIDFMGDFAVAFNQMIEQLKWRETELKEDASTDPLTGLYNRRTLETYLRREWNNAIKDEIEISAIMIDIDFFKQYNDRYGHIQGDACLIAVSKTIHDSVRSTQDLTVRYGGEEFIVIVYNTSATISIKIAEKIRLAVENLQIPLKCNSNETTNVTISLGIVSLVPTANLETTVFLNMADKALYRSKEAGRNCITIQEIEGDGPRVIIK